MDLEQSFLGAIRQRPGSYAERMIYADWLTDQGDPRGEFIHFQVQARRLPKGSPRRLDLETRAQDLLLLHEENWLGPLLGNIANWEWRAGLLDWVTMAADVRLGDEGVALLARSSSLTQLRVLHLTMTALRDTGLRALAGTGC